MPPSQEFNLTPITSYHIGILEQSGSSSSSSVMSTVTRDHQPIEKNLPLHHAIDDNCDPVSSDSNSNASINEDEQQARDPPPKQGRRVTFNPDIEIRDTIHVDDITDEEYFNYWLCDADYKLISEMASITVELIELGETEDIEQQLCFRGLKEKTKYMKSDFYYRYDKLVSIVLEEQDFQASRMISDPEYLAQLATRLTNCSAHKARSRAENDRCEAMCFTMNICHFV